MGRFLTLCISIFLALAVTNSFARKPERATAEPAGPATDGAALAPGVRSSDVLQLWTFENDQGGADGQGWTTVDRTYQPLYFHVDTYGAITPPKGLWCGAPPCQGPCEYATLPGYGNNWDQRWQSISYSGTGANLDVAFDLRYDTEASYDIVYLEYLDAGLTWHEMGRWSGQGSEAVHKTLTGGTYTNPIRFRIRFTSDASWSDEDGYYPTNGAAFIDNLEVADNGVTIDYHDFELESVGATATNDGHWAATVPPIFGNYASVFNGTTVVQQDPGFTDTTWLWGFFGASPNYYACGGYPAQRVVPLGTYGAIWEDNSFIKNEIRSPSVSLFGVGASEPVTLLFDAYPDLPVDNAVKWEYRVRSRVNGIWRDWRGGTTFYNDPAKAWHTYSYSLRPLITSGASEIQVAIGVIDLAEDYPWSGCHSHGPLIDNVRITHDNTVAGNHVVVHPNDDGTQAAPVTVTFDHVATTGSTTLTMGIDGPDVPGSFTFGNSLYYDLSTTATTTGNISVCINYEEGSLSVPESSLRMLHWDTNLNPDAWVDVTTSLNTTANTLCGTTDHLSPFIIGAGTVTAVGGGMPRAFALHQNVPNPFNPITTISYDVPAGGARVTIRVFDAGGRLVRTLVDDQKPEGVHDVTWDGRNTFGSQVSSGVYFYQMVSGSFTESKRMVLLK